MDNCPHCGKRLIRPGIAYCNNCGAPLKGEIAQAAATVHGGSLAKIVVHIPGEETREEFLSRRVTTIGRRSSNTIQVLAPIVSGEHARIELTPKGHTITDLNSTNGTYVNGKRLRPMQAHLLASNDIIRFSDDLGNTVQLTYIAPSVFTGVETARPDRRQYQIDTQVGYIGRNPKAAITLDHPAVSWNHARVLRRGDDRFTIQDLSSSNGTFLNGKQLRQRQEQPLARGDVIQIGPFNLVYQGQGIFIPYSAERNFRLELVDLEKTFYPSNLLGLPDRSRPHTVLKKVNLVINPREFVALVGGSGTGKSTLLKAMSGVSRATAGAVLVNGDNLYEHYNLYRTMMGYVPQDDIIHRNLPVQQALRYAARLRLPDAEAGEIEKLVSGVLEKVGLTAQADTLVRDLSGGQRKRVSIAAELLAEPWIFFLDEPTSGLDPGLEKLMMDTLRQLADEGRTIVLVTHATRNIIGHCDQAAFLARGGELAFFGPPDEALRFFNVEDFADIYTRLSQTYTPDNDTAVPEEIQAEYQAARRENPTAPLLAGPLWAARYRKSPLYQTYVVKRQSGEVARPDIGRRLKSGGGLGEQMRQFALLARRYGELIRRDRFSLAVLLAVMPLIGLLLLLISEPASLVGHSPEQIARFLEAEGVYTIVNKAQTLLFMMALAANLLGVFGASYEIIKEQAIYRRERMINLRLGPYYTSKFVVLGLFAVLQAFLLLLVLAVRIDFPASGAVVWAPLEYYFTLVFTTLASVALGLFISALASSRDMVIYLVLLAVFVQIVFSGAIFELSALTRPLSALTISRWSLEALGATTDMDALNSLGQVRVEREVDIGRGVQKVVEDFPTTVDFYINYTHSGLALVSRWIFLWLHTIFWSALAVWLIKRKDEI